MSKHLNKITADPTNYQYVLDAYDYYDSEYELYKKELDVRGQKIIAASSRIPQLAEAVWARYSEAEAIIAYMEKIEGQIIQKWRKHYTENYNRDLQANTVEKYIVNEPEVVDYCELVIRMKMISSKWKGLSKGVENLHFQLGHITDLRKHGIEDATI
jgi:hypothetical protein